MSADGHCMILSSMSYYIVQHCSFSYSFHAFALTTLFKNKFFLALSCLRCILIVFSLRVALACLQMHILGLKLGHFHTFPTFCCAYLHMFGVPVRCCWGQFRMTGGEWRPKPLPWNLVGNKTQMPGSILNFNLHKGSSSEQKSYWSHMVHISTAQAEEGFV